MQLRATIKVKSRHFNLEKGIDAALTALSYEAHQRALALTSGGVSSKQLAQMGHPFGRKALTAKDGTTRHNPRGAQRGSLPRLPINIQPGNDLQKHLQVLFISRYTVHLSFPGTPSAFVLSPGGLPYMVARGFWPEIYRQLQPALHASPKRIVKAALS